MKPEEERLNMNTIDHPVTGQAAPEYWTREIEEDGDCEIFYEDPSAQDKD